MGQLADLADKKEGTGVDGLAGRHALSTAHLRHYHQRMVLKEVFSQPGVSQAQLREATGLSRPTLATILERLVNQGFLIRDRTEVPRRGAPVGKYFLNDRTLRFLGIDVGPEGMFGQWMDSSGQRLESVQWSRQEILQACLDQAPLPWSGQAMTAGAIAVPAMFDPRSEVLERSTVFPELVGCGLREHAMATTGRPFHYVHNAAAAALTEWEPGSEDFVVYMIVGTSVGVGYADHYGPAGLGPHHGEVAHLPVGSAGPLCPICGRHGCLESWVGLPALARAVGMDQALPWNTPEGLYAVRAKLLACQGAWPPSVVPALDALATATEILTQVVGEVPIIVGGRIGEVLLEGVLERLSLRSAWLRPVVQPPRSAPSERWRVAFGAALYARNRWLQAFPEDSGPSAEGAN